MYSFITLSQFTASVHCDNVQLQYTVTMYSFSTLWQCTAAVHCHNVQLQYIVIMHNLSTLSQCSASGYFFLIKRPWASCSHARSRLQSSVVWCQPKVLVFNATLHPIKPCLNKDNCLGIKREHCEHCFLLTIIREQAHMNSFTAEVYGAFYIHFLRFWDLSSVLRWNHSSAKWNYYCVSCCILAKLYWWWSGVVVSALASINEVNKRRAQLVLRWVTVSGFNSRWGTFISVCDQPARSTQPGHPFVGRRNEYQSNDGNALRLGS